MVGEGGAPMADVTVTQDLGLTRLKCEGSTVCCALSELIKYVQRVSTSVVYLLVVGRVAL